MIMAQNGVVDAVVERLKQQAIVACGPNIVGDAKGEQGLKVHAWISMTGEKSTGLVEDVVVVRAAVAIVDVDAGDIKNAP